MKKLFITTTILSSLLVTPVVAKEKLYAINSGSLTGSHSVMTAGWANDLASEYDIQIIQAKGCVKTQAVLEKLKGEHAIYNYSSKWNKKEECSAIAPTQSTILYGDLVNGVVFTKNENNVPFATDGVTVAYTDDISGEWLSQIETNQNITFNKVRYGGSQELVVAVINGEADFSITSSPKHFYEKLGDLKAVYNLSSQEVEGIPSLHELGASSFTKVGSTVYAGPDRDSFRASMKEVYVDGSSSKNYHDVSLGTISYINKSIDENWELVQNN